MIALENLTRVDIAKIEVPPLSEWNWVPEVADLEELERKLSAPRASNGLPVTSRNTFQGQTDYGETY